MSNAGINITIGSFDIAIRSTLPEMTRGISRLYGDFPLSAADQFIDFQVDVAAPSLFRRWVRPQVNFAFDGKYPFKPLPIKQAFAMFEWGLNWVIANHAHQFAIVHSAVLERNGRGFIFPGMPGSGKSTLCAALVCRGWRLLSDEMALLSLRDGFLWPIPRPISLKNASIDIIRSLNADAMIGDVVADTAKGNVAHMRPPKASVDHANVPVRPSSVVFPTYRAGAKTEYTEVSKGRTLLRLAENSFNYPVLGTAGFNCLADAVEQCSCHNLVYSSLDEAIVLLEH